MYVYVCVCIQAYVDTYIYIYIYIYIYMYIYMYMCLCLCLCLCLCVCACVLGMLVKLATNCTTPSLGASGAVLWMVTPWKKKSSVSTHIVVYVWKIYTYVTYIRIYIHTYVCIHTYMYMYIYIYIRLQPHRSDTHTHTHTHTRTHTLGCNHSVPISRRAIRHHISTVYRSASRADDSRCRRSRLPRYATQPLSRLS